MKIAKLNDKEKVVDILTASFISNKSVDYIVVNDSSRIDRIKELMSYSFDTCMSFGKVFLSDNELGCALVSFPERKKTTIKSLMQELRLVLFGIGLKNALKAMSREKRISSHYPQQPIYYLWFIGVLPDYQSRGVGSGLLSDILVDAKHENRSVFLETSTFKNIHWYKKFGLNVYHELDFGYKLYLISQA